jgi:signal transduction histidine kinase/ActR/RegA family two-component response regulator
MYKKISLLFFLFISNIFFAQTDTPQVKEIKDILAKSGEYLNKLECDKSMLLAKTALQKAIKIDNPEQKARAYNLIGLNLEQYSDFKKAIFFYQKGLTYVDKISNNFVISSLHTNIANCYCFRKIDFKKGIYHYKKALYFINLLNDDYMIMYANLNITSAYFAVEDYNSGIKYLKTAEKLIESQDDLESKIMYNSLLGGYYTNKNDFDKSEKYYKTALKFCNENTKELLESNAAEVYDDISRMYAKKKDFSSAYEYMEKYNQLKDKLYEKEHSQVEKQSGMSSVLNEYKRQISHIEFEKQQQLELINQNKKVTILLFILSIILVLLLLSLYKNYLFKQKTNLLLVKNNKEIQKAKENAEELLTLKSQFISTISHELRTPLYGVVGIIDIIKDENPKLAKSDYMKSLSFSANYLLSLVNDVLQLSKFESRVIKLEDNEFNIFDEVSALFGSSNMIYNKNNNKVTFDIDPNIPKKLIGDNRRLAQILINLLDNSLKFTNQGEVALTINLIKNDDNYSYLKFEVKDTGIGIAPENQKLIFDNFVQIKNMNSPYQGTGIGLSIVHYLIEMFESTIEIESELGKGCAFNFTIKFKNRCNNEYLLQNINTEQSELVPINVLLIEDNKINQLVTQKALMKLNCNIEIVETGSEALNLITKDTFDLIVTDINLPDISGFEITKKIRNSKIKTPVFAVTAYSYDEIKLQAIESGIDEVFVKPFKSEELSAKIREYIYDDSDN